MKQKRRFRAALRNSLIQLFLKPLFKMYLYCYYHVINNLADINILSRAKKDEKSPCLDWFQTRAEKGQCLLLAYGHPGSVADRHSYTARETIPSVCAGKQIHGVGFAIHLFRVIFQNEYRASSIRRIGLLDNRPESIVERRVIAQETLGKDEFSTQSFRGAGEDYLLGHLDKIGIPLEAYFENGENAILPQHQDAKRPWRRESCIDIAVGFPLVSPWFYPEGFYLFSVGSADNGGETINHSFAHV